jgi:hypothetical protein
MIQLQFGSNIDERFAADGVQRLLRKCIISADFERILKIHMERPDDGVYWPYRHSVTGDENRVTN